MDRDLLIATVRKETGIKLDRADPVLATAVINDALLDHALAKLDASMRAMADRQSATAAAATEQQAEVSKQHLEDAKTAAAVLVNSSAEWVARQLRQSSEEATAFMLTELRKETAKAQAASRLALRFAWIAGGAAAITAAGLTGFLIAAL